MKKILLIISLFICIGAYSQDGSKIPQYEKIMINEAMVLDIAQLNWLSTPENMKIEPNSTTISFYSMSAIFGKRYNLSLAWGFGFSADNLKSNAFPEYGQDEITTMQAIPDEIDYSKNKLSNIFFDIPIELRIRTNPKNKKRNFKITLGAKVGYRLQSYHKYQGEDYSHLSYGDYVKFKQYRIKNIMPYRYGVYGRIGYGKFTAYGYYALTNVFVKDQGPAVTPFCIGISIIPVFKDEIHYKEYRKRIFTDDN